MKAVDLFQYRQLRSQGLSQEEIREKVLSFSEVRCDQKSQIAAFSIEQYRQDVELLTKQCKELETLLQEKSVAQTAMLQTKRALQSKLRERQALLSNLRSHGRSDLDGLYSWGQNASYQIAKEES